MMTAEKKQESHYHHGDLRNALIRAGLEILSMEDGQRKLSLREAARIAGVSQAAPYRHFANKEALLAAVANEGFRLLSERIQALASELPGQPEEQFHAAARAYLRFALDQQDHFRLMFNCMHKDLAVPANALYKELQTLIERCQQSGLLDPQDDRDDLTVCAWSGFHGMSSLFARRTLDFLQTSEERKEALMRSLSKKLLEGMRAAL